VLIAYVEWIMNNKSYRFIRYQQLHTLTLYSFSDTFVLYKEFCGFHAKCSQVTTIYD